MIYITVKQFKKPRQLTWEDVIADNVCMNDYSNDNSLSTGTITKKFESAPQEALDKIRVDKMIEWLKKFNENNKELISVNRKSLYYSFKIPKATGGFRQIDAPNDNLQNALRQLTTFLTEDCSILYHTAAFAYVKNRCITDCLKKHQKNNSQWYLKTDFSGFFPSTTLSFTMKMLSMIFPLSEICKNKEGFESLKKAISLGFLNGGLPQGTTLSPALTNILMIPIDHKIFNELASRKMVYTRYADDIHISAQENFPFKDVVNIIKETLKEFDAPYMIKNEKTHYGSSKGKNWCLGLMINGNNDITVGHKAKRYLKASLCSFILDTKNKKYWDLGDVQHLQGLLSYYMMIEKDYFNKIIKQQNEKWNVDVRKMFKAYMNGQFV